MAAQFVEAAKEVAESFEQGGDDSDTDVAQDDEESVVSEDSEEAVEGGNKDS